MKYRIKIRFVGGDLYTFDRVIFANIPYGSIDNEPYTEELSRAVNIAVANNHAVTGENDDPFGLPVATAINPHAILMAEYVADAREAYADAPFPGNPDVRVITHIVCPNCHSETYSYSEDEGTSFYHCFSCGHEEQVDE